MSVDPQQAAVMDALLSQVPVDGWTEVALRHALNSLGRPVEEAGLIFPNGAAEMVEAFAACADLAMQEAAAADPALPELRLPARVKAIITLRLRQNRPHKEAIRRALMWLALPRNAGLAVRITARTVDTIWYAAGDSAADFSWYTKRVVLAGVYGATLRFWLRDISDDDVETFLFLDRRLGEVGKFGAARRNTETAIRRVREKFGALPGRQI